MKFNIPIISSFLAGIMLLGCAVAEQETFELVEKTSEDGRYKYTTVKGDPLGARFYELDNGLKVITSVNPAEPRIQTMVSVRAGSKEDPQDNTGLAHYLEHLLFKGTDSLGTLDYESERVYLDQIDSLYEVFNQTTDEDERLKIYKKIDSVSQLAAQYAIPNEFDRLVSGLGGSGINAFTSTEQTAYISEMPSNQLENWARLEAERYRYPVLRLFHTELEVVYEEKNRALDSDSRKVFDGLLAGLFQNHTYGTQTTLGSVEHLKNPSLKAIREYYDKYYRPNNMAVILSGDLDPDEAVRIVDKHFSYMEPAEIPEFTFEPEEERDEPIEKTILGPEAENVAIGFRLPGAHHEDIIMLEVLSDLLSNGEAGLIDLNLNQQQRVVSSGSWTWIQNDYSMLTMYGSPRDNQSLEEVRDLLLEQLDKIKTGEFDEKMLQAIVNNLRFNRISQYESNSRRARILAQNFILQLPYEEYVRQPQRMEEVTKEDVVDFANRFFENNYVVVYKKEGEDDSITKLEKPPITPVETDREERSEFFKLVMNNEPDPIEPHFLDFENDINTFEIDDRLPVYYVENNENEMYRLYYVLDMGREHDLEMALAVSYLEYLGTSRYSPEEINQAFYSLATRYNISTGSDQVYVSLRGLESNFDDALELLHHLIADAVADEQALEDMVDRILRERRDQKQDQFTILRRAMANHAMYGEKNPFKHRLSEEELRAIDAETLVNKLHSLLDYEHKVYYYGQRSPEDLASSILEVHPMPAEFLPYPEPVKFERRETNEPIIYFVNYDMVQAEVLWINKSADFDPEIVPTARMFNSYFGFGMSSIVFQRIRESQALAYATFSGFITPSKKEDPFYIQSYVGTQSDKLNQAITGMNSLKQDMPVSQSAFENSRTALLNNLRTDRTIRHSILFAWESAQKRGIDYDLQKKVFEEAETFTIDDIIEFHNTYYKGNEYVYCIIGNKEHIDLKSLEAFGTVKELELEDIFGY